MSTHQNIIETAIYKVLKNSAMHRDLFLPKVIKTVDELTDGEQTCDTWAILTVLNKMSDAGTLNSSAVYTDSTLKVSAGVAYDLTDHGFELARRSNFNLEYCPLCNERNGVCRMRC